MTGHFISKKMFTLLKRKRCFVSDPKSGNTPPLNPIAASKPFEVVEVDLLEMGPTTRRNKYIVTIIDHSLSTSDHIPDKKAGTVMEALFGRWIYDDGRWPDILFSDRGAEFKNRIVASLCNLMGIQ
ncbi:hypothetical protein Aduo_012696 [Ancylostoma duodenale]